MDKASFDENGNLQAVVETPLGQSAANADCSVVNANPGVKSGEHDELVGLSDRRFASNRNDSASKSNSTSSQSTVVDASSKRRDNVAPAGSSPRRSDDASDRETDAKGDRSSRKIDGITDVPSSCTKKKRTDEAKEDNYMERCSMATPDVRNHDSKASTTGKFPNQRMLGQFKRA